MLNAVIFDFDGVIVDSEPLHFRAFQELMKPEGFAFTWDDYLTFFIGFDDRDAFRTLYAKAGRSLDEARLQELIQAKTGIFQRLVAEHGVAPYPGVVELFQGLHGKIPLGLCSGALRSDLAPVLSELGVLALLDVVITADDVPASKPDPECYAQCVRRLAERHPQRQIAAPGCVAIEDTPAGVEAAKGAGLNVLAVTNSHSAQKLRQADRVVPSLDGLGLRDLEALAG